MALFGKLFGKGQGNSVEDLLESLKNAQEKRNFVEIARLYYQIGEKYLKEGNQEKAWLYIMRFDALSSSRDEIYEKIPEKMMDQASEWIEEFENSDMYIYELSRWAEEQTEEMLGIQKVKWNILTMARFVKLFDQLSVIPGFELLGDYRKVVEILAKALYRPMTMEEYGIVLEFVKAFYPFTDSPELADVNNRVTLPDGTDFEGYDLIACDTLLNLYTLLDDLTRTAEGRIYEAEVSTDFVTNSLMPGYYVRTHEEPLREIPAVQAEEQRIREDYDFAMESDEEVFMERVHGYMELMHPQG